MRFWQFSFPYDQATGLPLPVEVATYEKIDETHRALLRATDRAKRRVIAASRSTGLYAKGLEIALRIQEREEHHARCLIENTMAARGRPISLVPDPALGGYRMEYAGGAS